MNRIYIFLKSLKNILKSQQKHLKPNKNCIPNKNVTVASSNLLLHSKAFLSGGGGRGRPPTKTKIPRPRVDNLAGTRYFFLSAKSYFFLDFDGVFRVATRVMGRFSQK